MRPLAAIDLKGWIDDNRRFLRPPVGNKVIWEDSEFIVMVVGGPNRRKDYHVDEGEELFYQIEGDIVLRIMQDGGPVDRRMSNSKSTSRNTGGRSGASR